MEPVHQDNGNTTNMFPRPGLLALMHKIKEQFIKWFEYNNITPKRLFKYIIYLLKDVFLTSVINGFNFVKKQFPIINEQYFKTLIENSSDAIVLIDKNSRVLYSSNSTAKVTGYDHGDFKGKANFEIIHPQDKDRAVKEFESLLINPEKTVRFECRIQHKNKGWRYIEGTASNMLHDLNIKGVVVNFRDVTERKAAEQRAILLSSIISSSEDAIISIDLSGIITSWNIGAQKIYGYSQQEIKGKSIRMLVPETKQTEVAEILNAFKNGSATNRLETKRITKDSKLIDVSLSASPIKDSSNGAVMGASMIMRDITERKIHENLLDKSLRQLEVILQGVTDGITALDADGKLIYANAAAAKLCGYASVTEMLARTPNQILDDYQLRDEEGGILPVEELPSRQALLGQSPEPLIVRFNDLKTGMERWSKVKSSPVFDQHGNVIMAVNIFRDITENRNTEHVLRYQAAHDVLTGLLNRKAFVEKLDQAINSSVDSGLAVMFLDLDRFKNINDTLGHDIGDMFLKEVARKLQRRLAEKDIIARLGGDEFIIMLNKISSPAEAERAARKILKQFIPPIYISGYSLHINASIGIAIFPHDGANFNTLMKNADVALDRAKESGGSQYKLYNLTMNLKATERLQLESSLRTAAQHNQLTLAFEPILSSVGSVIAIEALVRWNHPTLGRLFPSDFIDLAEKTGSITSIDNWVLRTVSRHIAECKRWLSKIPKITVNLSARQFIQEGCVEHIYRIIQEANIEPSHIELEITERIAMSNVQTNITKLKRLKEMGIQIIIDDFGTGYSSLTYLKSFPVHKIKIDQSFIKNCITDEHDAAIIKAIIAMAHSLKLQVIAEGVESEEQFSFLKSLNCDYIQGFLFSRPIPEKELLNWLYRNTGHPETLIRAS